jgi:purine-nucleoside phosphorylase
MADGDALERLRAWGADTAIVLGSGLNALVESPAAEHSISYSDFEDLPKPGVPGHHGRFVLGSAGERRVIYAQGRVHLYEGHSATRITAGIRVLGAAGIKRVILTNAAGTTNTDFKPGSWMMIIDHLNLTGTTPLLGTPSFIDMSEVYSRGWRSEFASAARQLGMTLHSGIYAGLLGPQYETPAEVRMLRGLGADAVGMSTVLEAIQARALGIEVAGFSCLTNWAAGIGASHLKHEEVLATGQAAASDFCRLLAASL